MKPKLLMAILSGASATYCGEESKSQGPKLVENKGSTGCNSKDD